MNQKSLSKWLKFIIIGVGICALLVYFLIVPVLGKDLVYSVGEDLNPFRYPPFLCWLGVIWLTAVPFFIALVFAWRVARNIGADRSFSMENAELLRRISVLAAVDAAFFFLANIVLMFLNMNHPGTLLAAMLVVFAGVAVAVASAALSHLIRKAADLQDESDLTI